MYAVEFLAKIKNGSIEIPEEYRTRLQKQVRVILLSDEPVQVNADKTSILDVLANSPGQRVFKTAADVDLYLNEERASWDR